MGVPAHRRNRPYAQELGLARCARPRRIPEVRIKAPKLGTPSVGLRMQL